MLAVNMSRAEADAFLKKLAQDDAFRRSFERNPHATLQRAGVLIPKEALPRDVTLPSKEEMTEFLKKGYANFFLGPRPRPYNGGCRTVSILYAIASVAKP
jgi:putative modified peptide